MRRVAAGIGAAIALAMCSVVVSAQGSAQPSAAFRTDLNHVSIVDVAGAYDRLPDADRNREFAIRQAAVREFLRTHTDDYDFVVAFTNFDYNLGSDPEGSKVGGRYYAIKNDVRGIGQTLFDDSAGWGSTGQLQGFIDMGPLARVITDPSDPNFERTLSTLAHEVEHRWGAFLHYRAQDGSISSALMGRDSAHWNFLLDSGNSVLYGNQWRNNGNGTFTSIGRSRSAYSPLDLYLMGMVPKTAVSPFTLVQNAAVDPTRLPETDVTVSGTASVITIDQVIAAEGERQPAAGDAQKRFKIAFLLLTRPGDRVDGARLEGINSIRDAFATRMTILTNGQGLVQVFPEEATDTPETPGPTLPGPGDPRPGPVDSTQGIAWLLARQRTDGLWGDSLATRVRDTGAALETLAAVPAAFMASERAKAALVMLGDPGSNDSLARQLAALGSQAPAGAAVALRSTENPSGGWGLARGQQSNPLDTALALLALPSDTSTAATAYLTGAQNVDGGWSIQAVGPSSVLATLAVLRAAGGKPALATAATRALTWLASHQNADGGFGDNGSTAGQTALGAQVLLAGQTHVGDLQFALDYLRHSQRPDGSWDESVYATALAVQVLKAGDLPNVAAVSIQLSPSSPIDSQAVTATARIRNDSATDLMNIVVRLSDGDPSAGQLIGEDLVIARLQAHAEQTVSRVWDSTDRAGAHTLVVTVDPANQVQEYNEADNVASANIVVRPPPQNADLTVTSADLSLDPAVLQSLPQTQGLTARVSNTGRTAATHAGVALYEGNPSSGGRLLSTTTVDVPARGSVNTRFTFDVQSSGARQYFVVVDPANQVPEADEANNQAAIALPVQPSVDLYAASGSVTFSSNPIALAQNVTISATVGNRGTTDAFAVRVRVFIDDPAGALDLGFLTVDVPAGQTRPVSVVWRTSRPVANLPVVVQVDPLNAFPETSESNNSASALLSVPPATGPNLQITHTELTVTQPVDQGGTATVSIRVHNAGLADAANVAVAFFQGVPGAGGVQIGATQTIPQLPSGGQAVASVQWIDIATSGDKLIYAVVDGSNQVEEYDEGDNTAFITVHVRSLPDLVISSGAISFMPSFPKEGDSVALMATIVNTGEQPATNVRVRILNGDPAAGGSQVGSDRIIPLIAGGSDQSVLVPVDGQAQPGATRLYVQVDPANEIRESSETNNTAGATLGVQDSSLFFSNLYFSPNGDGIQDTTDFFFRLTDAEAASVAVKDSQGKTVRVLPLEAPIEAGSVSWDGRDDRGAVVPDGSYSFALLSTEARELGSAGCTVDNNASPVADAIGTKFFAESNLTCSQPVPDVRLSTYFQNVGWLPDDSAMVSYFPRQSYCDYGAPVGNIRCTWRFTAEAETGIYLTAPDGERTRITPDSWTSPTDLRQISNVTMSGDGSRLLVETSRYATNFRQATQCSIFGCFPLGFYLDSLERTGPVEMWTMNTDGSGLTMVGSSTEDFPQIQWAPDGSRLLLSSYPAGLRIVKADGSGVITIDGTANDSYLYAFPDAFSADATKIAYLTYDPNTGVSALTIVDADGTNRRVLDLERGPSEVNWIGGNRLALKEYTGGNTAQLHILDIPNTGPPVSSATIPAIGSWVVAPDGTTIAYADDHESYGEVFDQVSTGVWTRDAAGHVEQVYSASPLNRGITGIAWNRDGSVLSFIEQVTTETRICDNEGPYFCGNAFAVVGRIDLGQGVPVVKLFPVNEPTAIRSSSDGISSVGLFPDGQSYLFSERTGSTYQSNYRLVAVSLADGKRTVVVDDPGANGYRVTPSGRHVLYESIRDMAVCRPGAPALQDTFVLSSLLNLTGSFTLQRDRSQLLFNGTAEDRNFKDYRFEYAPAVAGPLQWSPIGSPNDVDVINGPLATWVPPSDGSFYLRMTSADKAGNELSSRKRVTWGLTPTITNVTVAPRMFSPNADGVNDAVTVNYLVLGPVHIEAQVIDAQNHTLRTITQNHASIGPASFAWDGRDDAGAFVPDGQYHIDLLDYRFFVTVDTAPPTATLSLGSAFHTLPQKVQCVDVSGHQTCSLVTGPLVDVPFTELTGRAFDSSLARWRLERGQGLNPSSWVPVAEGTEVIAARNQSGAVQLPIADAVVRRLDDPADVAGTQYRLTVTDQAGNAAVAVSGLAAQEIVIHGWDRGVVPTSRVLEQQLGSHLLSVEQTMRVPIQAMTLQYRVAGSTGWINGPAIASREHLFDFVWDNSTVAGGHTYDVRIAADDVEGNHIASNVFQIHSDLFVLTSFEKDTGKTFGQASLRETLTSIRLVTASQPETDIGAGGAAFSDAVNFMIPVTADPTMSACLASSVSARYKGIGQTGAVYYSNALTVIRRGSKPAVCSSPTPSAGLDVRVQTLAASQCGMPNPERVVINLTGSGVQADSVKLFIQDSPNGLLREVPNVSLPYSTEIDTHGKPEGTYLVRATGLTIPAEGAAAVSLADLDSFIVDRAPPTAEINYPGPNQSLCAVKSGTQSLVNFEGVADDPNFDRYTIDIGVGEAPQSWTRVFPATSADLAASRSPKHGILAAWDTGNITRGTYTVRLQVFDKGGNVSCATVTFFFQGGVRLTSVAANQKLISPNGNGLFDSVGVGFTLDINALVDAKVYALTNGQPAAVPVRTLLAHATILAGTDQVLWDGHDDLGAVVPDGKYRILLEAFDVCGNSVRSFTDVEVDDTPPEAAITAPQSTDVPGVLQEIRGTANDPHFDHFVVEAGQGSAPLTWTLLARGSNPVIENLLAKWNNRGAAGQYTIRLTVYDRVGNQRIALVPISVPQRPLLVTSFSAEPTLFSPNGDGKLDTTVVAYETGETAHVVIEALDAGGGVVATLSDVPAQPAGMYQVVWNGERAPGVRVLDGDYRIRTVATAASDVNRTQTENATVRVDTTPPTLTPVMPADMSYVGAHFSVIGTVSDPNIDTYRVAYQPLSAGPPIVIDEGHQNRIAQSFGVLDLEAGGYLLTFTADDLAQNHAERTMTFVVDDTAPQTTIDTPESGAVVGGSTQTVDVRGAVTDANLDHWTLRFGVGSEPDTWTTIATGTGAPSSDLLAQWNVAAIADGPVTLSLQGTDKAGAVSEARVPVIVDNTTPLAAFASLDGSRITAATNISGTATDTNFKTATLEFSAGDAASAFQYAALVQLSHGVTSGTLFNWQALPQDGTYALRLTVEDAGGLTSRAFATVVIDTHPPLAPSNLTAVVEGGHHAHLRWVAPADEIAGFVVYRDGARVNAAPVQADTTEYVDQNLADGTHQYVVKAVDGSGLESAPSNQASAQIDSTPPQTRITAPAGGATVSGLVDIRGTAAAPDLKEYRVFASAAGGTPALVRRSPVPITNGLLAEWNTAGFAEGTLVTVRLEAEDLTGNVGSAQISVNIDNLSPQAPVLLSAVASGSNVVVQWQTGGESDLAGVLLYNNDVLANARRIVNGSVTPYLLGGSSFNDSGLRDNSYRYYAFAVDKAGNVSAQSNVLTVVVETTPPSARIIQPASGTAAEHQVTLVGSTADVDVASFQFQYLPTGGAWTNLGGPVTVPQRVFNLDGLPYDSFQSRVVATDTHGNVDPAPSSIVVVHKDLTPPAVPTGASTHVNGGSVSLTWQANTEADVAGYRIYRRSTGGDFQQISPDVTATRFDDLDLPDGFYDYALTAVDTTGNESALSASASAHVYAPLLNLPASCIGDPHLTTSGSGADPGATVTLYANVGGVLASVAVIHAGADGAFVFSPVTLNGGANRFAVQAVDGTGNTSKQSTFDVTYTPLPGTPEALRATVLGTRVSLQWNSTAEPIAGYSIHRDGTDLTGVRSVMAGATASASSSYVNAYPASNAIDGNPGTYWIPVYYQDPAPTWQLTFPSAVLITQVHISWYPGYEADYDLQAWNGTDWTTIRSVTDNSSEENVFDIESGVRTARLRLLLTDWDLPLLAEVSVSGRAIVTGTTFDDLNVATGRHTYTVSALNSCLLPSAPATVEVAVGDVTAPAAPTNLTASVNRHDVSLAWSANTESDLRGYNVYRTHDGATVKLTAAPVTTPAYVDSARPNGTYSYYVTALDTSSNESGHSNVADALVNVVVGAPQNLTVVAPAAGGELALAWHPAADATAQTSYSVYRAETTGGSYSELTASPIAALSYRDLTVLNGVRYFYVVRAIDAVGDRGGPSNEASGIASDLVSPNAPFITLPTDAAHPVLVDADRADVAGRSEGGALVTLIKQGTPIASATALAQSVDQLGLEPEGDIAIHGPTQLMAAFVRPPGYYYPQLSLTDLNTHATRYLPGAPYGESPVFSPDGSKIAYVLSYAPYILRIVDVQAGIVTSEFYLPGDADAYVFSPDGHAIAASINNDVAIVNADGTVTQLTTDGTGADSPAWTGDGASIVYLTSDCTRGPCLTLLRRVDVASGAATTLDAEAESSSIAVLADGHTVAYTSLRGGTPDVWLYDLAAGQARRALAPAASERFMEAASRDGGAIAYTQSDGNDDMLRVAQLSTGEITDLGVETGDSVTWGARLRLVQIDGSTGEATSIQVPGWFQFDGVPLEIGSNVFSAIASDAAGNTSAPSDAIRLTRSGETAPDLVVTSNDLVVYPVYPLPNSQVVVTATVHNAGQGAAHDVAVMFFDAGSGTDQLQPIGGVQMVSTIPAGGQVIVSAGWRAPSAAGRHTISVQVDPANTIAEASETNNTADKDAFVTPNGEPAVQLSLDRSGYQFSDAARIAVGVANPGTGADFQLDVVIEDLAGNRASLVDHRSIAGLTYASRAFNFSWPVSGVLAGQYRARAVLTRADGRKFEAASGFTVLATESATAAVSTNKAVYLATEPVLVTGRIQNTSANTDLTGLSATTQILDSHGAETFVSTQSIGTLFLDADAQVQASSPSLVPGNYTARLTVRTPTRELVQQSVAFAVEGVEQLAGRLTMSPALVGVGQSSSVSARVDNVGSLAIAGSRFHVVVVDPATQAQLRMFTQSADLAIGASTTWTTSIPTTGLRVQSYNVLLIAEMSATTTLASATLTVQDRQAPTVQIASPAPGAFFNAPFDITAVGSDDSSGIDRLEFSIDQGPFQSMPVADAAAGRYAVHVDVSTVPEGVRTLTVRGWDKAGNGPSTAVEDPNPVSVSFTVDRTAPSILITGVTEGTTYTAPVTPQIAVTDAHTFTQTILLNGLPYQSGTPVSESGTHALAVFATDAAGNTASAEVHFTILSDAPPAGRDQDVTTPEDVPIGIVLTAVTSTPGLTFAIKNGPTHGVLTGVAPAVTYTPAADFNGADAFTFTVSDGSRTSDPATVRITITPVNDPPDADAGRDQNAVIGTRVTLDGTASHDRDGNVITYRWMFVTIPAASGLTQASLLSATTARPFFTPDVPGPYTLSLIVNDGIVDSHPDEVIVQAAQPANVPPNANAGLDQHVPAGSLVHLSGAASSDPDNGPQPLSYAWRFVSVPPASQLTNGSFQTPFNVTTAFTPDVAGDYLVRLTVSDGSAEAVDDVRVTATASNAPPVANAGPDSMVMLGQAASLDGSASYDPDRGPQPLAYTWTFVSKPSGSCLTNSSITDAHAARASFVPDADGIYVLSLSVTDGASSASDNVAITVNSSIRASGEAWFIHDGVEERLSLDVTVVAGAIVQSSRLKYYHPKPDIELVPPRLESMTVSGNTATITGISTGHDTSGYRVIATVVDGAPDAFGITLIRPNGTLAYQYSKAVAGGDFRIWFSSGHSSSDHSNEGKDKHDDDAPPVCAP